MCRDHVRTHGALDGGTYACKADADQTRSCDIFAARGRFQDFFEVATDCEGIASRAGHTHPKAVSTNWEEWAMEGIEPIARISRFHRLMLAQHCPKTNPPICLIICLWIHPLSANLPF